MFAWRKRPQTPSIPDHPRCPVTWEEALTSWQVDGVTEATTTIYRHRVRTAVAAGSVPPLAELRESDLVAWRSQVLLTVASVRGQNMTLLALRRFLSAGIAAGWVSPSFTTAMIRQHLGGVPVPRNLPLTLAAWETRTRALMQAARTSRYYPAQATCIITTSVPRYALWQQVIDHLPRPPIGTLILQQQHDPWPFVRGGEVNPLSWYQRCIVWDGDTQDPTMHVPSLAPCYGTEIAVARSTRTPAPTPRAVLSRRST